MENFLHFLRITARKSCCNFPKILFVLVSILIQSMTAYSQNVDPKFNLSVKNTALKTVFESMCKQSSIDFIYSDDEIKNYKITVNLKNSSLNETMTEVLKDLPLAYEIKGDLIVVILPKVTKEVSEENLNVDGKLVDEAKMPIIGATLIVVGTAKGVISDDKGHFSLTAKRGDVIEINCVGMTPITYVVRESTSNLTLKMMANALAVKDVVVTGIYNRKAESFTGSYASFSAKDLKSIGGTNVLQSLKSLDPSFNIIENNEFGSDPNRLPDIEIRGKSSIMGMRDHLDADPNQPLFVLDGFVTTLSVINNLDLNRIESITLLKDAASTAIYGSKAANGVVVVETIKPKAGELRIGYNGTVSVSIPDLSSYNLMNANEKFRFEENIGRFRSIGESDSSDKELILNRMYNNRLADIAAGVDTYWLSQPLRTGINHRHSLSLEGGSEGFVFNVGGSYNGITGVMKQSDKEILSGNIDLSYNIKKFKFMNKFSVEHSTGNNPIVSFSEYADTNPYYRKTDEDGKISRWLEYEEDYFSAGNPLYNASHNSRDANKSIIYTNNFNAEYNPLSELMFRFRIGLSKTITDADYFLSPENTAYEEKTVLDRGDYTYTHGSRFSYEGELTATYAKLINDVHQINFVAGGLLSDANSLNQGYYAHGFPPGNFDVPSFSSGFKENSTPVYYSSIARSISAYANASYSYKSRYLVDASYRVSGSSVFGTGRRFAQTWSVGLAWNIHNESFIKDNLSGISMMKLRASIGNPGNQNFDSFMTFTTYKYDFNSFNYFGMSSFMDSLGNPDLKWQTTMDKNIGFDLTILNNRLTVNTDYYYKVTDPLLISINTPSSTGVRSITTNLGKQIANGFSATILGHIIYRPADRLIWSIRANVRAEGSKLDGIGNNLQALNQLGQTNKSLVRYYDGANPNDLWAVRSSGIDPATGNELFIRKDGSFTYDYSFSEEQIVGNSRPDLEGILGTSLKYKGFSVDINFRYRFGAEVFNNSIYTKVENIPTGRLDKNQDRRALEDRWQKAGDVAKYKNVASSISTPMSSRFIQKENLLSLESFRIGYEIPYEKVEMWGLSSMKFDAYMTDVFRMSTIKSERGTSYPFARSFQLSVSINF